MKTHRSYLLAALLGLSAILPAAAQEVLVTLGATVNVGGQPHAYILWQPQASEESLFKRYAVYSKSGAADSSAAFIREGIQTLQSSPRTMRAMLELGSKLDRDPLGAARRIDAMFRDLTLRTGQPPAASNLDAADKLAFILQSSATQPKLLGRLFFLGRAHAGVMLALGHAFTRAMPAGARTYEIREIDSSDSDLRVLGRVTLDPAAPLVLSAPGAPVVVPHAVDPEAAIPVSSKDHLNVRLRWGVDGDLRARLAHTFGFELLRVKKTVAEGLGWHLTPPQTADVLNLLSAISPANPSPDLAFSNELPILVQRPMTGQEATNVILDKERVYCADDGVRHDDAEGRRVLRPYVDGESFYFFTAARDITGRPGLFSPGTPVTMCDRVPPNPPRIESVLSTYTAPADKSQLAQQGGSQHLQLKFKQLPENAEEGAVRYFIYRWNSPQQSDGLPGDDPVNAPNIHVIGSVPHQPGRSFLTFDDKGLPEIPDVDMKLDKTVWYTIRAVGRTACAGLPTLSGHSAPMPGVLRDFKAPDAPGGVVTITHLVPEVGAPRLIFDPPANEADQTIFNQTRPAADFIGYSLSFTRTSPDIRSVRVRLATKQPLDQNNIRPPSKLFLSRVLDFQKGNNLLLHVPRALTTDDPSDAGTVEVEVQAISRTGLVSPLVVTTLPNQEPTPIPAYALALFTLNITRTQTAASQVVENVHQSVNEDGSFNYVRGLVVPQGEGLADIREWRVYRRVIPGGQLALIAKGEGSATTALPDGNWEDPSPPITPGTIVCYFAQVLDQNANASPLALLNCVRITGPALPTPMLLPVKPAVVDRGGLRLNLEWVCDPQGVDRFEVLIAQEGGGKPAIRGLTAVPRIGSGDTAAPATVSLPALPDLSFHPFQTLRLGTGGFASGPAFSVQLSLTAEELASYHFAVRAVEAGGGGVRAVGDVSNVVEASFVPNAAAQDVGVIPWPARPLPPGIVNPPADSDFQRGEGRILTLKEYSDLPFEGFTRLSDFQKEKFPAPTCFLIGAIFSPVQAELDGRVAFLTSAEKAPEKLFFPLRKDADNAAKAEPLGRFMLYRYQIPSAITFPNAKANLVQCTPLISVVSRGSGKVNGQSGTIVCDPYIAIFPVPGQANSTNGFTLNSITDVTLADGRPFLNGVQLAIGGTVSGLNLLPASTTPPTVVTPPHLEGANGLICLKDPLPVTEGARYQHVLVLFDERDEVTHVLPLDPVQH